MNASPFVNWDSCSRALVYVSVSQITVFLSLCFQSRYRSGYHITVMQVPCRKTTTKQTNKPKKTKQTKSKKADRKRETKNRTIQISMKYRKHLCNFKKNNFLSTSRQFFIWHSCHSSQCQTSLERPSISALCCNPAPVTCATQSHI